MIKADADADAQKDKMETTFQGTRKKQTTRKYHTEKDLLRRSQVVAVA